MLTSITLQAMKKKQKISMITCYDYCFAKIINDSDMDCILVGDSVSMVAHGFQSTTNATIDMMETHTQAVARGAPDKFIIADLPFLSYRISLKESVDAAGRLIQAGAQAVKLEGSDEKNSKTIQHLVESGIPVMGHLGLTPQAINTLGGHKVQGKSEDDANSILQQAQMLQDAGCFAIVLECIPTELATKITNTLAIPTIGIGAGANTDGQVLVLYDMLGLNKDFKPKFLKHFMSGYDSVLTAVNNFDHEVKQQQFPNDEQHSYHAEQS